MVLNISIQHKEFNLILIIISCKRLQILLSSSNNSTQHYSFVCMQLNGVKIKWMIKLFYLPHSGVPNRYYDSRVDLGVMSMKEHNPFSQSCWSGVSLSYAVWCPIQDTRCRGSYSSAENAVGVFYNSSRLDQLCVKSKVGGLFWFCFGFFLFAWLGFFLSDIFIFVAISYAEYHFISTGETKC